MTLGPRYIIMFFTIFSAANLFSQDVVNQSPSLVKSVLTQAGSSTISYEYTDETGVIKTTKVQQSIAQSGVVGGVNTSQSSVQQGFLNHIKVLKIDNTDVDFIETVDLTFYPNPFKDVVNIKFSVLPTYTVFVEVFDIRGRLVLDQKHPPSNLISIATNHLEDASYVVRVSSGSQEFLKKLIKGIN